MSRQLLFLINSVFPNFLQLSIVVAERGFRLTFFWLYSVVSTKGTVLKKNRKNSDSTTQLDVLKCRSKHGPSRIDVQKL